jgi:hypothetical protein
MFQLETTAADVLLGRRQIENVRRPDRIARFAGRLTVHQHLPGHDGALGLLAAWAETAFHERLVQTRSS